MDSERKYEDKEILEALIEFFGIGAKNNETTCDIPDKAILSWLERQVTDPE